MDERLTRRVAYSPDKRELLKLLLQKIAHKFNAFALSSAQQRLWFLDQLQPNSPLYHLPAAVHLNGPLDLLALAQSLQALVQRHEALRTRFMVVADQAVQIVAPNLRVPLPMLDLRALPAATREGAAQQLVREQAQRSFDLVRGPLLRTTLLRLDADAHVLLLSMHHLIADGWSLGIAVRDLTALYAAAVAGRPAALPDLPIQYADFAVWQRAWLQGSGVRGQGSGVRSQESDGDKGQTQNSKLKTQNSPLEAQLAYWQTQLAGAPTVLALPTDHPRPANPTLRGARQPLVLPERLAAALAALSRREGATLFMTLLAAFQLLLARYTDQEDLLVGTPVANRTRAATEQVIGCFVNTLVLRGDLSGNPTFRELVRRMRTVCLDAYAHQDLPFEHLVQVLQPERDLGHMPLVQVLFVQQNVLLPPLALAGLNVRLQELDTGTAKFDLTINLAEQAEGLVGWLEYASDLFEAATVARLAGHWQILLEGVVADADRRVAELPLLTAAERQQVLVEWNAPERGIRGQGSGVRNERFSSWLIHELFAAQAERSPDAVALVFDDRPLDAARGRRPTTDDRPSTTDHRPLTTDRGSPRHPNTQHPTPNTQQLTYDELNARANRLAHHLRALGIGPEMPVAICMERSVELLIGLLGVLKAGGAYVPLDPSYPPARLVFMLEDARAAVLLTTTDDRRPTNDLRLVTGDLRAQSKIQNPKSKIQNPLIVDLRADWEAIARERSENPVSLTAPENLAYVIYTSGSTGTPKGVAISHRSAGALIVWVGGVFTVAELRGVLAATSISFDLSVFELFVPWSYGGCVILAEQALLLGQLRCVEWVTLVNTVPSVLREVLRLGALPSSVRVVNLAGEPLDAALAQQVYALPQVARLFNLYGPSEDTTYSTYSCVPRDVDTPPAIGRPISHTQVYLLDRHMQPAPVGVVGELYLGGLGLARGYLNRPELTAERFVPNPFAGVLGVGGWGMEDSTPNTQHPSPNTRLYKTGDLVRYRADGQLEYLGRIDQQVKVRGFRIELGEVEAVLSRHPDIRDAVMVAHEEAPGDVRLVAYVVPKIEDRGLKIEDSASDARDPLSSILYPLSSELRGFLQTKLPDYMVPSAFVVLEALPRMLNGKVDRKALPAPAMAELEQARSYVAPRTPQEELLAAIWADVLGLARVGAYDHFFALGGHSLLATQVLVRVRETFQVELPLRTLFEAPTLATLAEEIARARRAGPAVAVPPLEPVVRAGALPLAFAQQRLWFIQQLDPRSTAYTIAAAVRLSGALDLLALAQSLQALVQRHEVLRTTFASVEGRPVQRIASTGRVPLPALDLRALPEARRESVARQLAREQARHRFDLVRGPLLRTTLLRLDAGEHVLLLTMHHIISDGWSLNVLVRELTALYAAFVAGRPAALPELPIQYADYAVWQRAWLQGSGVGGQGSGSRSQESDGDKGQTQNSRLKTQNSPLEAQLAYWRTQLRAPLPTLELPSDRPRPAAQTFRGAQQQVMLPASLTTALASLGQRTQVTRFMLLLAAFATLLARYTDQEELLVGAPVANRTQRAVEGLIGLFANTLVLRVDLSGNPRFRELLARVREVALEAYAHQDLPFEQLVEALAPVRDLSRNPVVQVMLALQEAPLPTQEVARLRLQAQVIDAGMAQFDLALHLAEREEALVGWLEYNSDLFEAATVVRLAGHWRTLLEGVVADPAQQLAGLPLLTAAERQQLLVDWNATSAATPRAASVHELVAAQVARTPDALAVVFDRGQGSGVRSQRDKGSGVRSQESGVRRQTMASAKLKTQNSKLKTTRLTPNTQHPTPNT